MYHRVADPAQDPFGLAVRPDRFAEHVEHLQRLSCVVPLLDWTLPSRAPRIALTFDDGYVDNATTAAPLLEQAGLPATWFVTTDILGGGRFWWDVLGDALLGTDARSLELSVAGTQLWLDLSTPESRRQALLLVRRRVRPLPPAALLEEVERVARACGAPPPEADSHAMSPEQLRELAARPGAEIGAHTRTHAHLGSQSAAVQREEVLGSVAAVAELVGAPVLTFAYPFGSRAAVGRLAPRLAAEAGCAVAVTTTHGVAGRDDDPHLLPRVAVADWDGATFAARVAAALAGRWR